MGNDSEKAAFVTDKDCGLGVGVSDQEHSNKKLSILFAIILYHVIIFSSASFTIKGCVRVCVSHVP